MGFLNNLVQPKPIIPQQSIYTNNEIRRKKKTYLCIVIKVLFAQGQQIVDGNVTGSLDVAHLEDTSHEIENLVGMLMMSNMIDVT